MQRVYLDHGATTPLRGEVLDSMQPFLCDDFGNPTSLHFYGDYASDTLEKARRQAAFLLGDQKGNVVFTGGGTEANNLALIGAAKKYGHLGKHIIVSQIEHDSILSACSFLEKEGFQISYVPVDQYGHVQPETIQNELTDQTILVSVMHANNEVGTIQPISAISQMIKDFRAANHKRVPYLHCDGIQSVGKIKVDVNELGVDLFSISAHKLYGPKGVGALYLRRGTRLEPLIYGGGQENGLRSGTQNVAGIIGLVKALQLAIEEQEERYAHDQRLNDSLRALVKKIKGVSLTVPAQYALPSHVHFRVVPVEGQAIMFELSRKGVAVATGSACHSGQWHPSHVLMSMGYSIDESHQGVRLTFGKDSTMEDIEYMARQLKSITHKFHSNVAL